MTSSYLHQGPFAPAQKGAAITPSDTVDVTINPTRAIFVGVGGDVNVLLAGDTNPVLLKNVANGTLLPLGVQRVYSSSTTATTIVALY